MKTSIPNVRSKAARVLAAGITLALIGATMPAGADTFGHDRRDDESARGYHDSRTGEPQRSREGRAERNDGRGYQPGRVADTRQEGKPVFGAVDSRREQQERTRTERHEQYRSRERVAPHRDYVVRELPREHRIVHIHDRDYYVHDGHYYIHEPRGYVLVPAPIGMFVLSLPDGFISVRIGSHPYFVFGGVFYHAERGGYTVVAPPAPGPDMVGQASEHIIVSVGLLNVRSGPSFDFAVLGVVNRGDRLPVYGHAPGWRYVRLPSGGYGWISNDFVDVAPAEPQG